VFAIASAALLKLRRTSDRHRPFRLWAGPAVAGFGAVLFAGLALASGFSDPEIPTQFSPAPALIVLGLGAVSTVYVLFVVPRLHRAAAARRAAARASGERVRRRPQRPA
jgi:hypothetical protein